MQSDLSPKRFRRFARAAVVVSVATIAVADIAAARSRSQDRTPPEPEFSGPAALAVVSIKDQRISLYDAEGGAVRARISSGQTGYETPVGVFSLLQKNEEHYSNLYDDASMPFMQRITWSGVALHAGALPGYPASHGCVRLPHDYAKRIFSLTKLGMRVVISRDDIAPVEIAHPLLFKPEPVGDLSIATEAAYQPSPATDEAKATILEPDVRNWPERQALLDLLRAEAADAAAEAKEAVTRWETLKADLKKHGSELALIAKRERATSVAQKAGVRLTKADRRLAEAKTPRALKRAEKEKADAAASFAAAETKLAEATKAAEEAEKIVERLNAGIAAAEAAKKEAVAAAADAKRKTLPISIFVSAKTQKLYVRQGNEPVFDTPVAVGDPASPIGTHVFTALDFANDGNDVRWNVVTISRRSSGEYLDYEDYDDMGDRGRSRKASEQKSYAPPVTNATAAAAALDRISIPSDVRARISRYVWPGSSLIVSDEELSKETGKATDFIVVASDEPQGALKTRKRQPPPSYYRDFYDDDYYFSPRPYGYQRRRAPRYNGFFDFW